MPTAQPGRPDRSSSGDPDDLAGARAADDAPADDLAGLDDLDGDDSVDDLDDAAGPAGTRTLTRARAGAATSVDTSTTTRQRARKASARRPRDQRTGNPFRAMFRFLREVVGEMRKVLWPTRRELVVYTIAVIIFVTIMISIVGGLDFGFARLILLIFG